MQLEVKPVKKAPVKRKIQALPEPTPAPPKECPSDASGYWHTKKNFQFTFKHLTYPTTVSFVGMITGCGVAQSHGWSSLLPSYGNAVKEEKERMIKALHGHLQTLKQDGVGAIVATLGDTFIKPSEKYILELGFKKLTDYSNYRHGQEGKYRQALYVLRIEDVIK